MNNIKKVVIRVPSEIKYIRQVSSRILDDASARKIDQSSLFDIRLCTEEAVRNAIVHGNRLDKRLHVKVTYWITDDGIGIEVEDEGKGFDHAAIPDPTAGDNILKQSGRGVYLIKNIMDRVEFNESGNLIRMTKGLKNT